jgi:hypothetical protein
MHCIFGYLRVFIYVRMLLCLHMHPCFMHVYIRVCMHTFIHIACALHNHISAPPKTQCRNSPPWNHRRSEPPTPTTTCARPACTSWCPRPCDLATQTAGQHAAPPQSTWPGRKHHAPRKIPMRSIVERPRVWDRTCDE